MIQVHFYKVDFGAECFLSNPPNNRNFWAKQNETKQNETKQNKSQNQTKRNKTRVLRRKPNETKQNKTKPHKTKRNKTKRNETKNWGSSDRDRDKKHSGHPATTGEGCTEQAFFSNY